jgi:putative oxidoreductase
MTAQVQRVPDITATPKVDTAGLVLLAARFLLAAEMMTYGTRKFLHPDNIYNVIDQRGLPGELVYLVYPWQFFFGWMCFLGFQTRIAAAALFGFCVIATSLFWTANLENFSRDYATAGGFLLVFIFGPGAISLDAKYGRDFVRRKFDWIWRNQALTDGLVLIARALIAFPFLGDAVKKVVRTAGEQTLFQGAGLSPSLVYPVALLELVFGLMVLVGFRTKVAVGVLLLWMLVQTFMIHGIAGFLGMPNADLATIISNLFTKNGGTLGSFYKDLAVMGALLTLVAYGAGRLSWDARTQMR